jgi:signal transduction histidine kinase
MRDFPRCIEEAVRHPILILDDNLRVVDANQPFYTVFNTEPAQAIGYSFYELGLSRWNIPLLRELVQRVIAKRDCFGEVEVVQEFESIGRRHLLINARKIPINDSDPMVLLAIQDVTEMRCAQDELKTLYLELDQRVAARTAELAIANQNLEDSSRKLAATNHELEAYCYSVSHDLRAPLRVIEGFSKELLEGHADGLAEKGRHYLNRIRSASQRMGELIDELLTLSRITSDGLNYERVDLTALAMAVVDELSQGCNRQSAVIGQ